MDECRSHSFNPTRVYFAGTKGAPADISAHRCRPLPMAMLPQSQREKRFVLVLGPHRSGTSLATSALEGLGASLALPVREASEENRRGFFEHADVIAFHERFLAALGGRWDNPLFDGPTALKARTAEDLEPWYQEAVTLLQRDFPLEGFCALKDPRVCQLLPFWMEVLKRCGLKEDQVSFLYLCRHPAVVAASQAKRFETRPDFYGLGADLKEGAALWLSLTRQCLSSLPSDRTMVMVYDQLIDAPAEHLTRLVSFLGLPHDAQAITQLANQVVDPNLRRSLLSDQAVMELRASLPQCLSLHENLAALAKEDSVSASSFTHLLKEYLPDDGEAAIRPIAASFLSRLTSERLELRASVHEQACLNREIKKELETSSEELELAITARRETDARLLEILSDQEQLLEDLESRHAEEVHRLKVEALEGVERFRRTISWRITKPLRAVRTIADRLKVRGSSGWLKLRGRARQTFLRLRTRSPRTADFLLTLIRPAFRLLDRMFLRGRRRSQEPMCTAGANSLAEIDCRYVAEPREETADPLVTVVVPNYNHAPYLRERLDSIYAQTYRNFEVILLDDCSTDDSRSILEDYQQRHPDITRLLFNENNSGSVFRQWRKAMDAAEGELIWIAESDDWCSEDFLEELVPSFHNEAVSLAYCRTDFMDQSGKKEVWSIEQFLADVDPKLWHGSFMMTAHQLVGRAWAKKNIVPNVSSAVFRNFSHLAVMDDEEWQGMRIAGDWVFYLHLIRGGLVAYSTRAVNYHRMHDANTSTATYATDAYYREHEMVAKTVNSLYEVSEDVFLEQRGIIRDHWIQNRDDFKEAALDACYSLAKIREAGVGRKPNLMMASFAFSAGGGETFPIQLANLFRKRGFAVTFLNCDQDRPEPGVRRMLAPEVPVVSNLAVLPEIIDDFGIDIIHSHHAWVDMSILDLLPEDSRCSTVVSLHGMYETVPERRLKTLLPRLLDRTGGLVYTADKNLTSIKEHGLYTEERFTKIGNALDVYPIEPLDLQQFGIPEGAFTLCNVSRAIPEKGWVESVAAVERARALCDEDIHLILIGEGPEFDQLKKVGTPEYVHLLGFRGDIRRFFAASDMGFLPSKFRGESFPLVVIDCLHAGVPVLASSLGEVAEMLDADGEVAGRLFPLDDWEIPIESLAELIAACAADTDSLAKMRALVPKAAEKFRPEVMCERYEEVYARLG